MADLTVTSVGGQFAIIVQFTADREFSSVGVSAGAREFDLRAWLYIDGSAVRDFFVPATVNFVNTSSDLIAYRIFGHYTIAHKEQLSAGSHLLEIRIQSLQNKGGSISIQTPTIIAMESRGFY